MKLFFVFLFLVLKIIIVYSIINKDHFPTRLCEHQSKNCNSIQDLSLSDTCFEKQNCDPKNKFYTFDGSCNNLNFPMRGQANNGFIRRLKADYADGFKSFRTAEDGSPLPNVRFVANNIFPIGSYRDNAYTVLFYAFGQYVTHDVAAIVAPNPAPCCLNNGPAPNMPAYCMPIKVPENDVFYSRFEVTCLAASRASSTEDTGCQIRPTFKINAATSFLDHSILYSSNKTIADSLRKFDRGQLKTIFIDGNEFPPTKNSCPLGGLDPTPGGQCMMIGDARPNLVPELTTQVIIFLRCHNYIANKLAEIHPNLNDENLFHVTRRILIALYQHVVYSEFLPILVGPEFMEKYNLFPLDTGYATGYDINMNPGTDVHYEAGAGRFPHSMVLGKVSYNHNNFNTHYLLRDKYFNQRFLTESDTFKNIIIAYAKNTCEKEDEHHSPEVRNFLFKSILNTPFGSDLMSIDLIRAREFGLRSWKDVRKACSLPVAENFHELHKYFLSHENVKQLKQLYKEVDDIEYYVGALCEKQLPKSISGPSAACVIGDAFFAWKFADRLFYEFESAQFTPDELQEIRKIASYAWFVCVSNPEIETIQMNPFKIPSVNNPMINCADITKNSFEVWEI